MFLSQFEFETTEISSEGGGNANYIGEDGDIYKFSLPITLLKFPEISPVFLFFTFVLLSAV